MTKTNDASTSLTAFSAQQHVRLDMLAPLVARLKSPSVSCIYCFGSLGRGTWQAGSDIDILVVDSSVKYLQGSTKFRDIEVDLIRVAEEELHLRLARKYPHNMNFLLNAMVESETLSASDNRCSELKQEATRLYSNGPPEMSRSERTTAANALHKLIAAAEKLARRAYQSPEASYLAGIRRDQAAIIALSLYFDVHHLWSKTIQDNLSTLRNRRPALYAVWLTYIASTSSADKLRSIRSMESIVFDSESPE